MRKSEEKTKFQFVDMLVMQRVLPIYLQRISGGIAMAQKQVLYHGSTIQGLNRILANAKSHVDGSKVAYFIVPIV